MQTSEKVGRLGRALCKLDRDVTLHGIRNLSGGRVPPDKFVKD